MHLSIFSPRGGEDTKELDTGFVQKHENEIPGLFQDNSRTFFSF